MDAKRKKSGVTLIEMLTVIGVIAILLGLIVPSLSMVRRIARETKQKAQLTTIALALEAFKNDYGDYPPSVGWEYTTPPAGSPLDYCGAQKLAEALLGFDLLGFHPDSLWDAAGNAYGLPPSIVNLQERRGPYLELATANAFTLYDLFVADGVLLDVDPLNPDRFLICDVFGVKKVTLANGETVKAGTPILYYRADTSSKRMEEDEADPFTGGGIYDYRDNAFLVGLGKIIKPRETPIAHPLWQSIEYFYEYIQDPKVTATDWPYRPDSYILISAGADGEYGTTDDITNFGN